MFSLEALFCHVDDFCTSFEPKWQKKRLSEGNKSRQRAKRLTLSEIITILIAFHQNHYRNFKHYYQDHVCIYWREAFPGLPSYQRFALMDALYLNSSVRLSFITVSVIVLASAFVSATKIQVCHNRRISSHPCF